MNDEGDAVSAFEGNIFGASEGFAVLVAGGSVVGGEDDQRVLSKPLGLDVIEDLPDAPVHLDDDVTARSVLDPSAGDPTTLFCAKMGHPVRRTSKRQSEPSEAPTRM